MVRRLNSSQKACPELQQAVMDMRLYVVAWCAYFLLHALMSGNVCVMHCA